jgi:two-component system phosphate regulon sensor histidine kinase PhoR
MIHSSLVLVYQRVLGFTTILCYAGATILSMAAIAAIAERSAPAALIWVLILGAGFLAVAGVNIQSAAKEQARDLEKLRNEAELSHIEVDRQRAAIDSLADGLEIGIFICDSRAVIQYANKRAMELFRIDQPAGRSIIAVTLSYDLEQLVLEAARSHTEQHKELNFAYPVERVGMATAWPEEAADHVFLSVYEITDLRRLERVRQDFVSNVSHELRTPLTIIRSMAETLLDEDVPNPDTTKRYLAKVVSEVDRLSMISNDLLILSAAESNPVRKQQCDIAELFHSTLNQLTSKSKDKGLSVEFIGLKHLEIAANPAQLSQVAINLIDNAINYTSSGGISVAVNQVDSEAVIEVKDSGMGISSEHLPRIFERFYRADKGRSRASGGTGLGLSIVKHIVEAHGGSIKVESSLNKGSTFTVRLPIGSVEPIA